MLVYVKLGGSLITDKTRPETPRPALIRRLASEIRRAREDCPSLQILLGHGSGSFGHVVGRAYNVRAGIRDARGWEGYARTAAAAARLNRIVTDLCLEEGLLVVSLPPSASAWCEDGDLVFMDTRPHRVLLQHGMVPLVFGDVALDAVRGGTIVSTEEVFAYLIRHDPALRPSQVILVGQVDGVYTSDPLRDPHARRLSLLDADSVQEVVGLGASHGVDVTGGMAAKVYLMAALVREFPHLTVHIISGEHPDALYRLLTDPSTSLGTKIVKKSPVSLNWSNPPLDNL